MRLFRKLLSKYKLVVSIVVVSIAAMLFVSFGIYTAYKNFTAAHIHNTLDTVLNLTNLAINSWANSEKSEVLIWSQNSEIIDATETLLKVRYGKTNLVSDKVHGKLRKLLNPVIQAKHYQGYFIVDVDGLNLSSMRDENIGFENLLSIESVFFGKIFAGSPAISNPKKADVLLPNTDGSFASSLPTMFVGSPIINAQGKTIAALLFRIDPKLDFSALLQRGRIGESGETYAFDEQANLISESRFNSELINIGLMDVDDSSTLTISIKDPGVLLLDSSAKPKEQWQPTIMAASAIAGQSSYNLEGYRDYRGVPVIGVWLWNDELNMGLTAEIDRREAYHGIENLSFILLYTVLVLTALIIAIGTIFIRNQEAEEYIRKTKGRREIIDGVLANISQGVAMFDANKKLLVWNEHYAQILELSDAQLSYGVSNMELAALLEKREFFGTGSSEEIAEKRVKFLWSKDTIRQDITFANGRTYDVMTQKTPNNEMVISYTDISDRVHAENESRKQQLELKRLNQQKEKLFSIIAHDLTNAFNSLIGFSRLLLDKSDKLNKSEIAEYVELINKSSQQAYEMMNNLMQWAKTQMNGITVQQENFNLGQMVNDELNAQNTIAKQKSIIIDNRISQDRYVFSDPELVRSVIRNLINNAIKFTPENGQITLSSEKVDCWEKVYVADNGVGMSVEKSTSLFNSEITKTTRGTVGETGTGLGSLICSELIRMQGGDINVEKSDNSGTSISFTLPTMN